MMDIRALVRLLRVTILAVVPPAFAQYASPAILSRGEAPSGMSQQSPTGLRFAATFTSNVTNGVLGVLAPVGTGQPADRPIAGGGVNLSIDGGANWQNSHVAWGYTGSLQDYAQNTTYNSYTQGLKLEYSHLFSPRLALSVHENAGMYSHIIPTADVAGVSGTTSAVESTIPSTDFFNNLTLYSTTQGNLTYQQSARLSFDVGGDYFRNELRSSGLFGSEGGIALGDVQYRLSPHVVIGANYSFLHYAYTRGIGGAYVHTGAFTVSWRLSRSTELSFFAGPARMESSFEQAVPIPPSILSVLCPPASRAGCPVREGVVISHSVSWLPNFQARISRGWRHGTIFVEAAESVTPGNGLFLTSKILSGSLGYSYSILRDWNISFSGNYRSALSEGNVTGQYNDSGGSYRMTRRITGHLILVSSFTVTRYKSGALSLYNRLIYLGSLGFGYASSDRSGAF